MIDEGNISSHSNTTPRNISNDQIPMMEEEVHSPTFDQAALNDTRTHKVITIPRSQKKVSAALGS